MIDTYLLEQFVAVAEHGTLVAAAESLHVSQPALSKSMKKLESEVGVPLFVRGNRKIELNATGALLVERAEAYLKQGRAMLEQVRAFDRSLRNISVGSCAPIPLIELSPVLAATFPEMSVTTQLDDSDGLLLGLSQDRYQLAVTSFEPGDPALHAMRFRTETMSLLVPASHPFFDYTSVAPADLDGQFLVSFDEIGVWGPWIEENFPGIRLLTVSNPESLQDAIGLGTALSFVSDYAYERGLHDKEQRIVPLDMENKSIAYHLVCRKQDLADYRKVFDRLGKH